MQKLLIKLTHQQKNGIQDKGLAFIAEALKMNQSINYLNLGVGAYII